MLGSMRKYILDLGTGEPRQVYGLEWAYQFERRCQDCQDGKPDIYRVAFDGDPDGVYVSTVFLGLDHNFMGVGPPLLWESLVFGGEYDGEMRRYTSKEEALRGHKELVGQVVEAT